MALPTERGKDGWLVLVLTRSVGLGGSKSLRRMATEPVVAVGLVHAYFNCCIRKGLVAVTQAQCRRYAYYLTPLDSLEKSRLSIEHVTSSFRFFREGKLDCVCC